MSRLSVPKFAACAAVSALLATAPSAAQAVTFGANLDAFAANNFANSTCASAPPDRILGPFGSQSCMWSYIDTSPNSLVAPASGTVTTVRVKVGATTGPMRVNVVRFLFQQTGDVAHPISAGPFLEAYGPQFTPDANATTTVPASLAMQEDSTPAPTDTKTIQVIDALALEVLAPNVPIPLFHSGVPLSYPIYPGPTGQGLAAPSPNALTSYNTIGYGVLMSADLDDAKAPAPGPPPAPAPGVLTPTPPTVALGRTTIPVKAGGVTVPIQCQGADCAGVLSLLKATGAAATARKATTYGSSRFSAKAGTTAKVKVKLNKAGRALLKKKRRATVLARVTFTAGSAPAKSFRITLKR